ncbi:MAG: hypothetical protein ABEI86_04745, partial [Halobacteriaceae archaeon]
MDYFDYGEDSDGFLDEVGSWDFDVDEFLEQSKENHRQRLHKELERIDKELEKRDQLHKELIKGLETKLDLYADRLD